MSKYCCDRMEFFIEKKIIEVDKEGYALVWNDWSTTDALDKYEKILYCPFCGRIL